MLQFFRRMSLILTILAKKSECAKFCKKKVSKFSRMPRFLPLSVIFFVDLQKKVFKFEQIGHFYSNFTFSDKFGKKKCLNLT